MKFGGRKHSTPEWLDEDWERRPVDRDEYENFWQELWQAKKLGKSRADQRAIYESYFEVGLVRYVKSKAEEDFRSLGLTRVVRRDRFGRFSKRGRRWQAI